MILTISDLESAARRRLPRRVYDFISGGAGAEASLRGNLDAFDEIRLVPNTMVDIRARSQATRFLGHDYGAPFGSAPMGLCNMAWPGTDEGVARAMNGARLPYGLSMAASSVLSEAAEWAGDHLWYQMYLCGREDLLDRQLEMVERLDVQVVVLTVDVPYPGRRLRDIRNGFSVPLKWTPSLLSDFATHPAWSLETLAKGAPRMRNLEALLDGSDGAKTSLKEMLAIFAEAVHSWEAVERLRARCKRKLVVKGVMNPLDATRLRSIGVDAVVVSNHGGRQLSSAVSPIAALPAVRQAVGPGFPLILDSGVRSGEDVVKALASGADFVLAGRAFLYGAAALGPVEGPEAVIQILRAEIDTAMAQLGASRPSDLSAAMIHKPAKHVARPAMAEAAQ